MCLIGTKGKIQIVSNSVSSVVISQREQHSKKPDIIRHKIVELCGDIPRIELFARKKVDGWDSWGNEVQNDVTLGENIYVNSNTTTSAVSRLRKP